MIRSLLVLPLAAFAAGGGGGDGAPPPKPRTHTIEIRGMEFHPAKLSLARGDTVVWVNRDIVPHTATATGKKKWDTGQLPQGAIGRHVFRQAGAASYFCSLHPMMHGELRIQ